MATPVRMQRLSKFAETSEVLEWFKSPGELVREGERLLLVSSDKAVVEISAPADGELLKIVAVAGSQVPAGTVLAWIGQPGEELEAENAAAYPPTEAPAARTRCAVPDEDQHSIVSHDQAKAAPAVRRLAAEQNIPLDRLTGSGPGGMITKADVETAIAEAARAREQGRRKISPVARRLAREHGLNIDRIRATGPGGTITRADVQRMLEKTTSTAQPAILSETSSSEDEKTVIPLGALRRVMARRMTVSHQTIVQATTVADVDMTEVVHLRERVPASYTAFIVKAAASAVAEYPLINASLENDAIIVNEHLHMGVAVTVDEGLLVPVIRHAETKTLAQIHREIKVLSERARSGSLTAQEMSGPTMTVTNSGVFGSLLFTPVIVAPQSATLGMGKVASTPVVREGQIAIREIMYLCLSYDHRFLDGAIAVRYLQQVRANLEDPISLLWDEKD